MRLVNKRAVVRALLRGAPASQVVLVNVGTTAAPNWALQPQAVDFSLTGDGSNGTDQLFLDARYDGDLGNEWGNLLSRTATMINASDRKAGMTAIQNTEVK